MSRTLDGKIISMSKILGQILTVWPLSLNAGKLKVILYDVMWWIYFMNGIVNLAAVVNGTLNHFTNLMNIMKSVMEITYLSESMFNLLYSKMKRKELQVLLTEVEQYYDSTAPQKMFLTNSYVKRTRAIFIVIPVTYIVCATVFASSPLVLPGRIIPLNTVYFLIPLDQYWGWCVTLILNIFIIMLSIISVLVDVIIFALLRHAAYKFAAVEVTLRLGELVATHQSALSYAQNIGHIIMPLVIKTIIAVSVDIISCCFLVLRNVPVFELLQFLFITCLSILRLFVCCWCAEVTTTKAYNLTWKVYSMPWYDTHASVRNSISIIIQRCQKATVVSASGIMPALSLNFCGLVLYKTFSYYMTLRAILTV